MTLKESSIFAGSYVSSLVAARLFFLKEDPKMFQLSGDDADCTPAFMMIQVPAAHGPGMVLGEVGFFFFRGRKTMERWWLEGMTREETMSWNPTLLQVFDQIKNSTLKQQFRHGNHKMDAKHIKTHPVPFVVRSISDMFQFPPLEKKTRCFFASSSLFLTGVMERLTRRAFE